MKLFTSLLLTVLVAIGIVGCGHMQEPTPEKNTVQPENIDKNNVGITAGEQPDQTDPTLIEGNLEKNDFKN